MPTTTSNQSKQNNNALFSVNRDPQLEGKSCVNTKVREIIMDLGKYVHDHVTLLTLNTNVKDKDP